MPCFLIFLLGRRQFYSDSNNGVLSPPLPPSLFLSIYLQKKLHRYTESSAKDAKGVDDVFVKMIKQIDKVRKSLLHVFVPLRMVMAAMMEARADSIILYVLALFSLLYFYFLFCVAVLVLVQDQGKEEKDCTIL